jgi:hypothetical protein
MRRRHRLIRSGFVSGCWRNVKREVCKCGILRERCRYQETNRACLMAYASVKMARRRSVRQPYCTRPARRLTYLKVPCTRLVITSGAWSPRVFSTLFPTATTRIPISSLGGHSLLVRNPHFNPEEPDKERCHAVFATDTLGFSPEWFARTGGELYLAGLNSTMIPLPEVGTEVKASEKAIEQMTACARAMMMGVPGKEFEVLRESLVCSHHSLSCVLC